MRGKAWSREEEKQLQEMIHEEKSVRAIAKALGKTRDCIRMKIARLGLEVVVQPKKLDRTTTTTAIKVPDELPTIEDVMKIMSKALGDLKQGGIDQTEVIRLRSLIQAVKIYKELFARDAFRLQIIHGSANPQAPRQPCHHYPHNCDSFVIRHTAQIPIQPDYPNRLSRDRVNQTITVRRHLFRNKRETTDPPLRSHSNTQPTPRAGTKFRDSHAGDERRKTGCIEKAKNTGNRNQHTNRD